MAEPLVFCSRCQRDMTDVVTGASFVGIAFLMTCESVEDAEAWARIYPDLPVPISRAYCWVCWLTAMDREAVQHG